MMGESPHSATHSPHSIPATVSHPHRTAASGVAGVKSGKIDPQNRAQNTFLTCSFFPNAMIAISALKKSYVLRNKQLTKKAKVRCIPTFY